MKNRPFALFLALLFSLSPAWSTAATEPPREDWLLGRTAARAAVRHDERRREITIGNGLLARTIRLAPNAATVAFDNLTTGETLLRAVAPEAEVEINGRRYAIGGLTGQPNLAYLRRDWVDAMKTDASSFQFSRFETGASIERMPWKRTRHAANAVWPAAGASLTLWFTPPAGELPGVEAAVHYELYDGAPLLSKWLTIHNRSNQPLRVNTFKSELLRVVEAESQVDPSTEWQRPRLTVLSDYSFGGMSVASLHRAVFWMDDPAYKTQVNYELKTPCLLEVKPPLGPDIDIAPGAVLTGIRAFELLHDNDDRERQGLAIRKLYRLMAPWATENPLMMHLTSTDPKVVYPAIDQAAECGFEMVIISFGSGFNMEDASPENIAKFKAFREYANRKGLELGGYSLLASRRISDEHDVINPKTGRTGGAIFGNSPCLESQWGRDYFAKIKTFMRETGFNLLEHDGNYPGDVCASTAHPGHRGLNDSQWTQYQRITEFYRWCRAQGIYLNVPDNYFLAGSNKVGMGYRETNWSLPREQQHIHARQNLFDGTWMKTPSMGWMFVPLVQYQGGGAAATIEPLREHLADYEMHLANNLGYGAQACFRGPRLYDSPETKALVIKWVTWFKQHRDILESDVIHLRRADGRNLDAVLHVNPALPTKGLVMVYNSGDAPLRQEIVLPLYYTGLSDAARVSERGARPVRMALDRQYRITIRPDVPARSSTWFEIR
ncbi:MAG: alpha-galactosidase [Blastocatellia bacterium]|nr:alpha-galactosidase [Blastocatellia bacterium]